MVLVSKFHCICSYALYRNCLYSANDLFPIGRDQEKVGMQNVDLNDSLYHNHLQRLHHSTGSLTS